MRILKPMNQIILSEAMDELEDILRPDEIQDAMPSVHQKSQPGFQYPDLIQIHWRDNARLCGE